MLIFIDVTGENTFIFRCRSLLELTVRLLKDFGIVSIIDAMNYVGSVNEVL